MKSRMIDNDSIMKSTYPCHSPSRTDACRSSGNSFHLECPLPTQDSSTMLTTQKLWDLQSAFTREGGQTYIKS